MNDYKKGYCDALDNARILLDIAQQSAQQVSYWVADGILLKLKEKATDE